MEEDEKRKTRRMEEKGRKRQKMEENRGEKGRGRGRRELSLGVSARRKQKRVEWSKQKGALRERVQEYLKAQKRGSHEWEDGVGEMLRISCFKGSSVVMEEVW